MFLHIPHNVISIVCSVYILCVRCFGGICLSSLEEKEKLFEEEEKQKADRGGNQAEADEKGRLQVL